MTEIVKIGTAEMRLQDCMEYMRTLPDKAFDLAVVDPPYMEDYAKLIYPGAAISTTGIKRNRFQSKYWQVPNVEYFFELRRVSKNQIVWGANHFSDVIGDSSSCWIVWDKQNDESNFADAELAFASFSTAVKIFRYTWNGMIQGDMKNKEQRIHPTQKPIKLYEWLLKNYAKPGQRILDTHLGSMSSVIACLNHGFEIVGCELDADYFKAGVERVQKSQQQQRLFEPMLLGAA